MKALVDAKADKEDINALDEVKYPGLMAENIERGVCSHPLENFQRNKSFCTLSKALSQADISSPDLHIKHRQIRLSGKVGLARLSDRGFTWYV